MILFVFLSCSSQQGLLKGSSIFSSKIELGISKQKFILEFGSPLTKDLELRGDSLLERLYYVEFIDNVIVTTSFTFLNDQLIKQSISDINYTSKKIEDLKSQIKRNRLQLIMK